MSLIKYTADIVKSYVLRNEIAPQDIPELIDSVHRSLAAVSSEGEAAMEGETAAAGFAPDTPVERPARKKDPVPFVPIDQAVTHDAVICLICGKANKAIKGHLSRTHGIDVKTYIALFSLPKGFAMVAPSYSEKRRKLAIDAGLGDKLREGRKKKA